MKKLLALLMIWLLLPIAGAEETYTMQDGSLILMDGAGRKCQPIAMKPDFPEALLADADISGAIQLNLPEALLPDYHRLSQAERERAERLAAEAAANKQ